MLYGNSVGFPVEEIPWSAPDARSGRVRRGSRASTNHTPSRKYANMAVRSEIHPQVSDLMDRLSVQARGSCCLAFGKSNCRV